MKEAEKLFFSRAFEIALSLTQINFSRNSQRKHECLKREGLGTRAATGTDLDAVLSETSRSPQDGSGVILLQERSSHCPRKRGIWIRTTWVQVLALALLREHGLT